MDARLEAELCRVIGVPGVSDIPGVGRVELIQSLWSGCGQVARVWVEGRGAEGAGASKEQSVVIKHVKMPTRIEHPRGWNTDRSAQRKVRSYDVETHWYAQYSGRCGSAAGGCRVPGYLGHAAWGDERLLVLEDIDAGGFDGRRDASGICAVGATRAALAGAKAAGLSVESGMGVGTVVTPRRASVWRCCRRMRAGSGVGMAGGRLPRLIAGGGRAGSKSPRKPGLWGADVVGFGLWMENAGHPMQ